MHVTANLPPCPLRIRLDHVRVHFLTVDDLKEEIQEQRDILQSETAVKYHIQAYVTHTTYFDAAGSSHNPTNALKGLCFSWHAV